MLKIDSTILRGALLFTAIGVCLSPLISAVGSFAEQGNWSCAEAAQVDSTDDLATAQVGHESCCTNQGFDSDSAPDRSPCSDPLDCPCHFLVGTGVLIAPCSPTTHRFISPIVAIIRTTAQLPTHLGCRDPLLRPPIV